ncbi:sensor histidine kinase [Vibrio sp.]|uniref:sensor histidine kinase n=1 Tax=Vibrio sp. TaxID=678 RepID=UPI003D102B94
MLASSHARQVPHGYFFSSLLSVAKPFRALSPLSFRRLRQLLFHLLLLMVAGSPLPVHSASDDLVQRVGVLAFRGEQKAIARWLPTVDYLSEKIEGHQFILQPLSLEQLNQAVIDGEIDFIITNPGQFVRLGSKYGMSWLATLKSTQRNGRQPVIGSALIVRSDSTFTSLSDLTNAKLGAVSSQAFGGYQIYWGEMASQGIKPTRHFSSIEYSGFPVDQLLYWVESRRVDAAVAPACLLETMNIEGQIELEDFRVIQPKMIEGYDCQTSTDLYPNWSFAKLSHTSLELSERVAQMLLALPESSLPAQAANSLGWTVPVSSYDIHKLYDKLEIHPWQLPWWQSLKNWMINNWRWGLGIILVIVLGGFHHIWVQYLVKKRTQQLQQKKAELLSQQQLLEHAQRVAILGELSTELAHELNQPLTAINSFAEGGQIRFGESANHEIGRLLKRISGEAQRGAKIINRVRHFARQQPQVRDNININDLIKETLALVDYDLNKYGITVEFTTSDLPVFANIDPLEIQQLLINLIRNALDAMREQSDSRVLSINVASTQDNGTVNLTIKDTGVGMTAEQLAKLFKPFYTTKTDGLGLGMSICKRIIDSHQGEITISANVPQGTKIECLLPGEIHD